MYSFTITYKNNIRRILRVLCRILRVLYKQNSAYN
jgi:hypothetical protein